MQARWLVGGALPVLAMVLATSVAEAQPSAAAPSAPAPDGAADTAADAEDPLPAPEPQARPAPTAPQPRAASAPTAYPPTGYPPGAYPGYPPAGYWQPGAYAPAFVMPAEERTADYRLQLVVADLAGFVAIGVGHERGALLALGNYVVTPMLIHAAHGEGTRVAASIGLRLGLPLLGGLLGSLHREPYYCRDGYVGDGDYYYDDCGDNDGTVALGIGLGVLTAMIIDDGFLGRSHRIEKPRPSWSPRISLAPTRDHQVGSVSLGVAGQF